MRIRTVVVSLLVVLVALVSLGLVLVPRQSTAAPSLTGDILPSRVAPSFRLPDQFGHPVSLTNLRGRPVVLTFLRAHCRETCPLIAEELRLSVSELGAAGKSVALLVVSTDPEGDTRAAVQSFSRAHSLLHRWQYLTGTRQQLAAIWHAYYIYAPPAGANEALADGHTTATYLIDRDGRQRVLWTGGLDNAMVGRDLRILLGIPVSITLKNAAPEVGHPAPAFSLDGAHGGRLSLAAFHGKVVLLNFWATWCKPCRSEMPQLAAWYRQEQRRGLVVLGVDMEEPRGDVLSFLQQLHIPYPVGLDESGSISGRYQVNVLPVSFLIDRHGTVQSVRIGVVDSVYRMTQVQPFLSEQ